MNPPQTSRGLLVRHDSTDRAQATLYDKKLAYAAPELAHHPRASPLMNCRFTAASFPANCVLVLIAIRGARAVSMTTTLR